LRLVDATSRVLRDDKTSLAPELAPLFQRLQVDQNAWQATFAKLLTRHERIPSRLGSQAPLPDRFRPRPRVRSRIADRPPRHSPHPARFA